MDTVRLRVRPMLNVGLSLGFRLVLGFKLGLGLGLGLWLGSWLRFDPSLGSMHSCHLLKYLIICLNRFYHMIESISAYVQNSLFQHIIKYI